MFNFKAKTCFPFQHAQGHSVLICPLILSVKKKPIVTPSGTRMSKLTKNVKRIISANVTDSFQSAKYPTSGFL